jgi:hypothetical protein
MLLCLKFYSYVDGLIFKDELKCNLRRNSQAISILGEVRVSKKILYEQNEALVFIYAKGASFPIYLLGFGLIVANFIFWQSWAVHWIGIIISSLVLFWTPLPYMVASKLLLNKLKIKSKVKFIDSEKAIIDEMRHEANFYGTD